MHVADESTADVDGLHAKLDRKKKVEASNKTAKEIFQDDFGECITTMKTSQADYCELQTMFCTTIKDEFSKFTYLVSVLKSLIIYFLCIVLLK